MVDYIQEYINCTTGNFTEEKDIWCKTFIEILIEMKNKQQITSRQYGILILWLEGNTQKKIAKLYNTNQPGICRTLKLVINKVNKILNEVA